MKKKILIVDDQENIRFLLNVTFKNEDYELIFAENGINAIELAETEIPDLIIMDIMMPDMDGYTTISKIRTNSNCKNTPVIVITAKDGREFKNISNAFGAIYHFTKPFDPEIILRKANEILL